jgi:hypothetical protein
MLSLRPVPRSSLHDFQAFMQIPPKCNAQFDWMVVASAGTMSQFTGYPNQELTEFGVLFPSGYRNLSISWGATPEESYLLHDSRR